MALLCWTFNSHFLFDFFFQTCGLCWSWWMSAAIFTAVRRLFPGFLSWHLPLKPRSVSVRTTLSFASVRVGFFKPLLNSLPCLSPLMCQIQQHGHNNNNNNNNCDTCKRLTQFTEAEILILVASWEKAFWSNFETNIQSPACVGLWLSLSVTPPAEVILTCEEAALLYSSLNVSEGNVCD